MLENIENRYKYYYNNLDINTRVEKVEASSKASAKKEKKPERKKMTKADIGGGIDNPFIGKLSCCKKMTKADIGGEMILGLGNYAVVPKNDFTENANANVIKAHYSGPQVETFVHVAGMGLR